MNEIRPIRATLSEPAQTGFTLIEVLVSLAIFSLALLGYSTVSSKVQARQLEIAQRIYGINLVDIMASQLAANVGARDCYNLGATEVGLGHSQDYSCAIADNPEGKQQAEDDINQWSYLLQGGGETVLGAPVAGLINARGCIVREGDSFVVSVAWQGLLETSAGSAGIDCGAGSYGSDRLRRVFSRTVYLPDPSM